MKGDNRVTRALTCGYACLLVWGRGALWPTLHTWAGVARPLPKESCTVIEAHRLTIRYETPAAVDGITFAFNQGRSPGPETNGDGKSTTLRMILGLDGPTAGQVLVNGRHYVQRAPGVRAGTNQREDNQPPPASKNRVANAQQKR